MKFYHINKRGTPVVCKAQPGNCPLGGEHFERKNLAYEKLARNYNSLPIPITKSSISKIYRVGGLEAPVKHFPELDYIYDTIDQQCPEDRSGRKNTLYFSLSQKAAQRWDKRLRGYIDEPVEAVEAVIDPETTYAYKISSYEKVSSHLSYYYEKWQIHGKDLPDNLRDEVNEYWKSGILIKDLWGKIESGELDESDLSDYEVFVPSDNLEKVKVFKDGLPYLLQ